MNSPPELSPAHAVRAVPAGLLARPLAFLLAEHLHFRHQCRALEEVTVMQAVPPDLLQWLANFLKTGMPLHHRDEEEGLFPILCQRAAPEDDIGRVIGILSADHDADRAMALELEARLDASGGGGFATQPALVRMIRCFAAHKRRHIALENAVVMPIAQLRLTAADQQRLSRSMAARRAGQPVRMIGQLA
ncbi:hemerythrin domain-containing protein [Sandaracinobacteroides sp. A072]|uniref:hemerythrin domain-containing protein n=1 Tax=Sandaracinobacteroides sp. A072 TaxID=3461146 RepID=UPI004042DBCC